jgi:RNA polymerase sigma-70 factor, ECF subfamily
MMVASTMARASVTVATDRDVLGRCRAQDPAAFRVFVTQHQRMVFALLSRLLGRATGRHEIEDLAQETFVRAYRAFPGFDLDGRAKPSTWLLTIATRLALDAKKRAGRDTTPLSDALVAETTPESFLERSQLGRDLERAAMQLPDDQRAALLLAEVHDLSMSEIADALDVPEATAKTRLFRAREKMRALLDPTWRPS